MMQMDCAQMMGGAGARREPGKCRAAQSPPPTLQEIPARFAQTDCCSSLFRHIRLPSSLTTSFA